MIHCGGVNFAFFFFFLVIFFMWALKTLEFWHCRQIYSRSGSCSHVFWFMCFQASKLGMSRTRRGAGRPLVVSGASVNSAGKQKHGRLYLGQLKVKVNG